MISQDDPIYNANLADAAVSNAQQAAQTRIQRCPWFATIAVFHTQQGDIVNEIATALGTMAKGYQLGMCVVVGTPNADDQSANISALDLDPFYLSVDIYCDPLTVDSSKGVRKSVDGVALNVLRLLKGWNPPGFRGPLSSSKPTIFDVPDTSGSGLVVRRVALRGAITLPVLRLEGEGLFPVSQ